MIEAHYRAMKGKTRKKEVILFDMDLESNICNIINQIKNNTYQFGKYREFYVYEPKQRLIKSLPYKDRVVHQWYVEEFIKPYFFPRLINHTFACLDNRGTHSAVNLTKRYMKTMKRKYGSYYVLKCDVKKYFYSIDKVILLQILKNKIKDKKLIDFTKLILRDDEEKGIPIGNYTSQYFANIYLDQLDQYIKHELHIKYYIRYMDDFVLLLPTKKEAKSIKNKISSFLKENLNLELNNKSKYYPSKFGIDFCGYRIFEDYILLRKRSKKKIYKNVEIWNRLFINKPYTKKVYASWTSWVGHAKLANSYNFRKKVKEKIKFNNDFNY